MDGAPRPVLDALVALGVPAEMYGRNDIRAGGAKLSGAAQCKYNGRWLHHGTLLFDTDMDMLSRALDTDGSKFSSKGVGSKRSATVNIKTFLDTDTLSFMRMVYEKLHVALGLEDIVLPDAQWEEVRRLDAERYSTREWNYEQCPPYDYAVVYKTSGGTAQVNTSVRQGMIEQVRLIGDFFGVRDAGGLEEALRGARCRSADVLRRLDERGMDVGEYIWGGENAAFAGLFDVTG